MRRNTRLDAVGSASLFSIEIQLQELVKLALTSETKFTVYILNNYKFN